MAETPEGSHGPADEPVDDIKARYKQALDRKQGRHRDEPGHPEADTTRHGTHGRSGGKREFRRKSGG